MISIVIPTIQGREHHLERCIDAYERFTDEYELIIVPNERCCGLAWEKGGAQAEGDYIHLSADDLEPHEGWSEPAILCVEQDKLPCPRILRPDGSLESCGEWGTEMPEGTETTIARVPFLSREMWDDGGWIFRGHYYTDNAIYERGRQIGYPTVVCRDYLFTHYYASEGRLETMDEDFQRYKQWVQS